MTPLRILAVLGVSLLTFFLPACHRDSGKIRLAFVSNNAHGFWTYAESGCKKAAKDFDVEVEFRRPSEGTAAQQKTIVENLMDMGVKGIAVSPNDPGNFEDYLKREVNAKIPLVMADNDLPDVSARRCYIGTHNYRAGRAAGALVKKALPKGKIAVFVGKMDATNAVERRQGMLDYLAGKDQEEMTEKTPPGATDLKVGEYVLVATVTDDAKKGGCQRKASEMLTVQPDLACLVGLWEYNPPELLLAATEAKSKAIIVGFDENFETLEGIQKGTIFGTVVQNPYKFGYESIKILAGLARGEAGVLKDRKDIDANQRIFIPHRVVVRNPGQEKIGNSETVDVDVFYPEVRKLRGE